MRGMGVGGERRKVMACPLDEGYGVFISGNVKDFKRRQRRRLGARSHITPDHSGALDGRVSPGLHLVLEILVRRHARHVDAVAGDIVFPAMIDAADAAFLVASKKQRGAAVRAPM